LETTNRRGKRLKQGHLQPPISLTNHDKHYTAAVSRDKNENKKMKEKTDIVAMSEVKNAKEII
jgi:urocanate hydratase